ncbi:hydroxymethylglutaryl-CoA synthase [Convivina praedatoris]|uniref:Hydroxymethylglutaryl-CoA synthase n=1 Tax=Convivina praedatoris TaxID=2880963 RepID=A0ABN8H932_9LACO|nr:hydroxymethylglutaryl-CoA synthase [Convivina sp. LMG 32447]CAH1852124.1 Hydroxymethylglutaryl-CoA synthase [Convivina sp. LMG 32447]CAH1853829.1 Hydroxymethylglutaryl-CoA synthase [Convivina sp. LMG 32447]CAH1854260.1 Hydroxymethylglutaryl-CoA synthase [Convivina sp. LMG 32447]
MQVGIDQIAFYTPDYVLNLTDLAQAREIDPDKFKIGIGQDWQAVVPNYEDVVTMAVNASRKIIDADNSHQIDEVIFATESGIDNSKSAAIYLKKLLELPDYLRTIEVKQACYGGTYALMSARDYVMLHPDRKVLVVAADIARYGLNTAGEVTQGAGAIAMLVSADPQLAVINNDSVFMSREVTDFWRPLDSDTALVDGHLSTEIYLTMFVELWQKYCQKNKQTIADVSAFAFHLPYTKMGKKALNQIIDQASVDQQESLTKRLLASQQYSRQVGNLYTGSVYLSLLSLLAHDDSLQAGDQVNLFSFGSGAEAELFSLTLQPDYQDLINATVLDYQLAQRQRLSVVEYEKMFKSQLYDSHQDQETTALDDRTICQFYGWRAGQRLYR